MDESLKRFDMSIPPRHTKWYLKGLISLLILPDLIKHKNKLTKIGMEGIKPPYLLLCNHNAFMDFKVATKAISPYSANYVVAIDGFIGREGLLRDVGCICKRKFTNDITLIRQLKTTIEHGDVAIIYPEARYSLCGTTAVLPSSLGKLCKLLGVPVVSLICHGHHVNSPFWNLHDRGIKPTEAEMTLLYTPEQLKDTPAEEINRRLVEAFSYDDFAWQKARGIKTSYKKHAEGLHKVLYRCPHCNTDFSMKSSGMQLSCSACGKTWTLSPLSELSGDDGVTEFSHIPDWYEWERDCVCEEVLNGTYSTGLLEVHIDTLPNAKKFLHLGQGTMIHDMDGFKVTGTDTEGKPFELIKTPASLYSCHIEYEYLGKFGDCVDLNTLTDTLYIYPHGENFSVTKMALATEELYNAVMGQVKNNIPGIA